MTHNPFVPYLNRYTTASPDHEAAFDEFIGQTPPPGGAPLRLETRTEAFVRDCFARPRPPSVILTGNAGDGKTYLCRQIVAAFTGQAVVDWADRLDWPIERDGVTLRVVKDVSEMAEEAGANLLWELALDQLEAQPRFVFLIAANEGRLRAVLQRERLEDLYREIDSQLREGPDLSNDRLIVLNLNQVTTSTYVPPALAWLTDPARWAACAACPARETCPIYFNARRLAEPSIARRVQRLYQVLEHLGVHVTIRDMLIHLAYTVTGGLDCDRVQGQPPLHWEPQRHVYYENVWGEAADEHFRRKAVVIRHLRRLNVGQMSVFEVDDFIINGRPADPAAQAEHERLFAPALDLGGRCFGQERAAYLYGGATAPRPEEEHPLMQWLPHCRRKLFFEWQETTAADRLFPFQHLPEYFRLVDGDPALLAHYRREIILGLNRAFSGLYLTDADALYVTSQYAHAVEQPVPLVRLKIPADGIALQPAPAQTGAFDRDLTTLRLVIYPPPGVKAEPLTWPVDLLRFEYLMRRARGSTPDILAEECELSIRQLKDDLLARFAVAPPPGRIDFFAADRNRYTFRTLWVDPGGRIRI
jgi:hypothetical protein